MAKSQTTRSYSAMSRPSGELTDVISVVIRCPEDRTWLISYDQLVGFYIPYVTTKGATWGQRVSSFLKEFVNLPTLQKYGKLWRIMRVWKGDEGGFLTNAIFDVVVTPELKKKLTVCKNAKGVEKAWWVYDLELESAGKSKTLVAPDMLAFLPGYGDTDAMFDIYHNCALVESSTLIEVPKEIVLPVANNCIYDTLIENMELKPQHLLLVYSEFLKLSFPYLILGTCGVEKIATLAGWKEDIWKIGMRGVDMNDKGGLSFKELLYLISLVEPNYCPTGPAAEARARILFRCFDSNRSQKLSPKQFNDFMACLRSSQQTTSISSLDNEIEQGMRALDLKKGSDVPLQHFLQAISLQKLKGVDSMLKTKHSIISSLIYNAQSKLEGGEMSAKLKKPGLAEVEESEIEFKLSNHLAKVMHGRFNESIPLANNEGMWSSPRPTRLSKDLSDDQRVGSNACEQVLLLLKYFTSPYCVHDAKGQEKPKKTFDWETFADFESFVKSTIAVSEQAAKIFEGEPRLLSLNSPIYVFGDIHGNIRDITCYDRYVWPLGIGLLGARVLFLGDYVDRGSCGIEVVAFLFAQKIRCPSQVYLIRGNHEVRNIQKNFTFYDECMKRCGQDLGNRLWGAINNAFDYMPLAAIIDKKLFCCHGGIPPPWNCPTVQMIKSIPQCLPQPEKNAIAWNLLWNDPVREDQITEALQMELLSNNGFAKNKKRGTAYVFDTVALEKFLSVNNLSYVIRAHEVQEQGFQIHHKGKIITVFSSSYYNGGLNSSGCLLIKLGRLKLIQINTNEYHL